MNTPKDILKTFWGFSAFRPLQEQIINDVLLNKDVVILLPTGGGKSLCYQLPALLSDGCTLVISPLISLMQDQVNELNAKGIKSMMFNNTQPISVQLDNCIYGKYKLIYCSPEKTLSKEFQARIKELNINRIAVDEAHCISEWGNDFRPAFKQLKFLRELLPDVPIIAATGTATPIVLKDIRSSLSLKNDSVFKSTFARPNIRISIQHTEDKYGALIKLLSQRKDSGIVYCGSRRETEEVASLLQNNGVSSDYFHGGKSTSEKQELLQNWKTERIKVMVATNAFGMGIDKNEVSCVIHLNLPFSIENYYQEIGRAGRNGSIADAVLLVHQNDKNRIKSQYLTSLPDKEFIKTCYKNLCNYLYVAYGEGFELVSNFSLSNFCASYSLNSKRALTTLSYLEQEGVFNLLQYSKHRATVEFTLNQSQTLELFKTKTQDSRVIQQIIRNHAGVFQNKVELDLNMLTNLTKLPFKTVIKALQKWHAEGNLILDYNETDIQLQWLVPREDDYTLAPLFNRLSQYNKVKKKKIEAMITYAFSNETCKQKEILNYFGEQLSKNCQQCSASDCTTPKKVKQRLLELQKIICLHLKDKEMNMRELNYSIANYTTFEVSESIRLLLNTEQIYLTKTNTLRLK